MNEKTEKNYISVGAMSRLSGVHVKSLRYYDAIGALKPAYVNPETGYRYYTHDQLHLLEAIQLCVELDIPLSGFREFIDERGRLQYARLVERGRSLALRKIRAIKDDLDYLADMGRIIERGEKYANGDIRQTFADRERLLWLSPYDGAISYSDSYAIFLKMMGDITDSGLGFGYEMGVLFVRRGGREDRYYYVTVNGADEHALERSNVTLVPALEHTGLVLPESGIARADELFPEIASADCYIFEIEIPTGNYDYSAPMYEVRVARM